MSSASAPDITAPETPAPTYTGRRVVGMIATAAAAAFLATFNETFLNVALTPIMMSFRVSVETVQWLTTAYLLVAAVCVPVANVLYHRFSTRPLFVATTAFLVAGSVIGALAPTFEVLLVGRLVQAIGTGLLTPIGMNITLAVAPRHKLGLAMGIMAAMTTLGPSMAIVASGMLLSVAPWWMLMWVFGALSLIVLLIGATLLRNVAKLGHPAFDILSFLLITIGLVGLLYGISTAFAGAASGAAGAVATGSAAVGLIALIAFAARQNRIASPLIDLRPFRSTPFVLGMVMTMLGLVFVFAMDVLVPIFLQSARGIEPLGASLTLAPGILLTVVLGPIAGRLFDQHGGRVSIVAGYLAMAVFVALVALAAGTSSTPLIGLLYIPAVLGTAFVIGPAQTFALSHLDRDAAPHGITIISTGFQIAGCVGTTLAVGVYGALSRLDVGEGEAPALFGFHGVAALLVVTSLIGIAVSVIAHRSAGGRRGKDAAVPAVHAG